MKTWAEWNDQTPGFVEVDLVGHDGGDSNGTFCWSLTVSDVATGWTEVRTVRSKGERVVAEPCSRSSWRCRSTSPGSTLRAELTVVRHRYNTVRLHAGIGYVTRDDEHQDRGEAIRKAREAGLEAARLNRLVRQRPSQKLNQDQDPAMFGVIERRSTTNSQTHRSHGSDRFHSIPSRIQRTDRNRGSSIPAGSSAPAPATTGAPPS